MIRVLVVDDNQEFRQAVREQSAIYLNKVQVLRTEGVPFSRH
jgi:hypothetical protein